MKLAGVGVWSAQLRFGDPNDIAEMAAELEELGYTALWIPDTGGPVFDAVDHLLGATRTTVIATGILNLWMHSPEETAQRHATATAAHGDRFLVGIGVSHAPLIDADEPGRYRRPLTAMSQFLDGLDAATPLLAPENRVLAALGPKMLALAARRAHGVHPYLVTPEHTQLARAAVGSQGLVLPEQTAILCTTRDEARAIGETWLGHYLKLPNYVNSLLRLGFSDDDVTSISDRLFDAVIVWGDEATIRARVDEHRSAGADHVCLQVLGEGQSAPREQWRQLAAALT